MIKLLNPLAIDGRIVEAFKTISLPPDLETRIVKNGNGVLVGVAQAVDFGEGFDNSDLESEFPVEDKFQGGEDLDEEFEEVLSLGEGLNLDLDEDLDEDLGEDEDLADAIALKNHQPVFGRGLK